MDTFPDWLSYTALAALTAALFALRLLAPPNLLDQDQERPASYVLDVTKNGNWLCQADWTGDLTSKPPVLTWLCSVIALACGRIGLVPLYLPGALGMLGVAALGYRLARPPFGRRAAFLGAVACLLSPAGIKGVALARTDGVFAFTVTLCAFFAWNSWVRGKGWVWFWLAGAAATLTKGPLGLAFAASGLLALLLEKRDGGNLPLRGSNWLGIGAFLIVTVGWFLLAYSVAGDALVKKMIGNEFLGHGFVSGKTYIPGMYIYKQPLYYLGRSAPWSVLGYMGLWRVWKRPSALPLTRAFERFLFCWFVPGLLLLSLVPHQRADLLWPIIPAAALLAGRELDRIALRMSPNRFAALFGAAVFAAFIGFAVNYFVFLARKPVVRQSVQVRDMARRVEELGGREFPLTHIDTPMAFQVYLDTMRLPVAPSRAAELLRGADPVFIAVSNVKILQHERKPSDPDWHVVMRPTGYVTDLSVTILSNQREMVLPRTWSFTQGSICLRGFDLRLLKGGDRNFVAQPLSEAAELLIANESAAREEFTVLFATGSRRRAIRQVVGPGQTASFKPPP